MAYSVRYIMTWLSQRGEDCRIEILEKDYTGEAAVKKMGSQPVMRIDSSEGGIIGTSLQISIQADVDGELKHLYTTDSKKYKTILYKNDIPIWSGYLLQELYSENYIAPPYDVNLTATDQIALLKDVPYSAIGRMTLLEIIKKALQPTALELDFTIQASMKPTVLTEDVPFLSYITVNDYSFADSTCYEALQQILSTCNMALMQIDNRWHIYRINDISAKVYEYSNSLGLQQIVSAEPITIGQMHTDAVCPIGSLALRKIAAKKDAKFSFAPRQAQSILVDPAMTTGDGWFWNIDYINAKPGKFQLEFGPFAQIGASAVVNAFILESTLEQTKEFALWQNANVKKVDTTIKAQVSYLPLNSGLFTSSETTTNTVKLLIHFKLTTADGAVYYLNKDGWGNEDFQEIVFTGSMVYDSGAALRSNKDNYTTATIEIPGFPADGLLTVSFRNDSRIRPAVTGGPSDTDNPPFRVYPRIGITDVFITFPEIEGYDTTVKVAPDAAQSGEEHSITFADAYQIDNEELILYNFIEYPQVGKISKWQLLDLEFDTFYKAMIQDIANMTGLVKDGFSGVIGGKNLLSLSYLEKFSSSKLRLVSGEYNLYTDELSGEWEEIPGQMVQVGSYDTVVNNSGVVITGGSSSSSITPGGGSGTGSGNYVTNVALEAALAPILDWFELRTLETGTKILFTKYTLVSALDQIAGGVGEGGSSSSGAAYNRLDTWENYNEDAGDVLSAKLGYDLKQQIDQLQQSGGSGESVVANITVKIGDAEYTAVDGVVSLPAYPIMPDVPTLVSELQNDAGYITNAALVGYATQSWVQQQKYLTSIPSEYITATGLSSILVNYQSKITSSNKLDYSLLENTPTIPSAVTESTVSGWGFTKNAGTVTEVKMNGASKTPTNGVIDLGSVITAHQDLSNYATLSDIEPLDERLTIIESTYLDSITQQMVIDALDYTPFDSTSFTKANIKSALGIADWALASSKPSYSWDEITSRPTLLSQFTDDIVAGKYLPLTGGVLSGALSVPNINITSAAAVAHLAFGRQGGNIITAPSGGYFTFIPGGKSVATANADLVITDGIVYPGTTGVTKLGFGNKRWSQVVSVDGDFSGALTAGTFSTANVVSCGGRLRINASNSVNSFGFLKATAYTSALNRAVLDIGSNYGGTADITSEAVDVVAMSMYRGAVGVGRAFTYDELYANRASNVMLSVEGNINNVGDIVSTGEQVAGSDMRYKIVKSKFRLSSAIIAHAPLFRFKWKNHKTTKLKIGTSAQYWEEFAPELVTFDSVSDFKHLNYAGLGVAIGISNAREIEQLKKEIVSLKERLSKYEHN